MQVTVELFAQLGRVAGFSSRVVECQEGETVQGLLGQLSDSLGPEFRAMMLDESGELRKELLLCVDERQVSWSSPHVLRDQSLVFLGSPIAGG